MNRLALQSDAGKSALNRLGFKLSSPARRPMGNYQNHEITPNGKTETALSHGTRKFSQLAQIFRCRPRPSSFVLDFSLSLTRTRTTRRTMRLRLCRAVFIKWLLMNYGVKEIAELFPP